MNDAPTPSTNADAAADCSNLIADVPERPYWPTESWQTASPEDHCLDPDQLARAQAHLAEHYPHVDSLLVIRHGYLVTEHYSNSAGPDALHNVKSVTKSVLSALFGIALDTGDLESLDVPVSDYLATYLASTDDRRKREITIRDLLTMRSGLDWSEWGPNTIEMTASKDWIRYVLDRPLIHDPGTHFNYSTGDTQLLSGVLYRAAGMVAADYADLYLFGPLGIRRREWPADPQGYTIGGAELSLTPRDLAKIGYLYLNGGIWEGEQLLPRDWVLASTRTQVRVIPASATGTPVCYGYLWWLRPQQDHPSFMAVGYGGQYIYAVPDLDLLVVITGDLKQAPEAFTDNRMIRDFNVVQDYIIPAVTG